MHGGFDYKLAGLQLWRYLTGSEKVSEEYPVEKHQGASYFDPQLPRSSYDALL